MSGSESWFSYQVDSRFPAILEKKRNASRKTSLVSIRPGGDRGSIISTKSDQSFYSIGSYRSSNRSSSGNSSLGRKFN